MTLLTVHTSSDLKDIYSSQTRMMLIFSNVKGEFRKNLHAALFSFLSSSKNDIKPTELLCFPHLRIKFKFILRLDACMCAVNEYV